MDLASPELIIVCADCGASRRAGPTSKGGPRTPAGWKRRGRERYCARCWSRRYVLRAVAIPVAEPLDSTWEDLRAALGEMWALTTAASNWMMTELYARDVRRADQDKMPPMAGVYLYPDARAQFPGLPPQSIVAVEHACQRKYRAARYEVIWTRARSLPTYRYPTPFPVHNQSWSAETENERPVVSVRIADRRYRLRLKGSPQFHRQRQAFDQILSGAAERGELAIYRRGSALMVKMAAWLPRAEAPGELSGVLAVYAGPDSLLVGLDASGEEVWRYNGDHLPRWVAEHRNRLRRWAEDEVHEPGAIPPFAARREAAARKFQDRMTGACHEIAAQLAAYALRRRFAAVRYSDEDRSFCSGFPWSRLRALIAENLDRRGIALEIGNGLMRHRQAQPENPAVRLPAAAFGRGC